MLTLTRFNSTMYDTTGVILWNKKVICHTLELPWRGNARGISCIPEGQYNVNKHISSRFGLCLHINNVTDREGILIHAGNGISDTKGCILVGLDTDGISLIQSKLALSRLLAVVPNETKIRIKNYDLAV